MRRLDIFWQDKHLVSATKIDTANGINAALMPGILPQDNEKAINDILLKRTLAGKFNFEYLEIKLLVTT